MRLWSTRILRHALAALVVVIITWELACRVDDRLSAGVPILSRYGMNNLYRDSQWGPIGNPGARFGKWHINSEGFRGPESADLSGRITVLTYGASETFGMYEKEGNEFPRRLETLLNADGTNRYRVRNMGLPGMRVGSGARYLAHVVKEYRARVVVMYPTPAHYIGVSRAYCDRALQPLPEGWNSAPMLRLPERFSDLIKATLPRAIMTQLRVWSIDLSMHGQVPLQQVDETSYQAWEDDLRCAIRSARSSGATLPILVTHANRFGHMETSEDNYWLVAWRQQYKTLDERAFLGHEKRSNEILARIAAEEGVPLVDADAVMSGHREYFHDYAHFTDEGSAIIAQLIYQKLAERLEIEDRPGN